MTQHYVVFIGATPSLSTELNGLAKRIRSCVVVAPAMKKGQTVVCEASVAAYAKMLYAELAKLPSHTEPARLSVWYYDALSEAQLTLLWQSFGKAAWVEAIQNDLRDKDSQTRVHMEKSIGGLTPLLHEVSGSVYAGRKHSPLSLPLENFESNITQEMKRFWYRKLSFGDLQKSINRLVTLYKQTRFEGGVAYEDDRHLVFSPAKDTECHGKVHPSGLSPRSFIAGRFRFGVAIFPGFHYDVSSSKTSTLQVSVVDCEGNTRSLRSEKRKYINIFPNDHLLPEK